jgi:hypothetical protein
LTLKNFGNEIFQRFFGQWIRSRFDDDVDIGEKVLIELKLAAIEVRTPFELSSLYLVRRGTIDLCFSSATSAIYSENV